MRLRDKTVDELLKMKFEAEYSIRDNQVQRDFHNRAIARKEAKILGINRELRRRER